MDGAIMALLNILLAIPGLVLLLALISFLAPPGTASPSSQTFWATIALSILTVPTIARVTRAQTMVWGDRDFVMADKKWGFYFDDAPPGEQSGGERRVSMPLRWGPPKPGEPGEPARIPTGTLAILWSFVSKPTAGGNGSGKP
jgi:hypothetical protein